MNEFLTTLTAIAASAFSPSTAALAIAAIGLNIHFGYTGLLNMGQAGFMLVGAYAFAISIVAGIPLFPAVLIALVAAAVFALILGVPTLKLRGDYLAIVTISAAEIVRMIGRSSLLTDITGGSNGLTGQSYRGPFTDLSFLGDGQTTLGPFTYDNTGSNGWWIRLVAWSIVGILCLFVFLLMRSPWGRVLRGIREDEDAIRSLGKNVYSYKMQALILGGTIGALGGIIYVLPASVQADSMGRSMTFFVWTALLLGGAATVFGPVLGSIIFFALRLFVQGIAGQFVPDSIMNGQQAEQFSWILIGVVLMLVVIFRPQGVLGNKKELSFNVN
ncbi:MULTISPECIES: branched-chain amino acid ABC transporter permease [unclassified Cryobacterium]|uniref:branched-chain amino acid ABC transporter permease n=1 Tax=unclassified Cryobacterium TaxID=2649013 RepID=UPI002AB3A8F9|nr:MULTISPECIES: branched-chain amino acid ABC transporter permease [unclassified Cryobacterium]MDY7541484.1 branched-chain amino acid ABC transporter permease [Cryobacterium sp. 5B3]MEA9999564.1 branched-chain amino acid ABC transporter permease [Cryobacterium sp. RTS3]MEB0265694.1 branched-chain amino acid ABC transporter permease [Cryobacterium sp. 10I5]MEB0274827.1 branched-chain amino acid ABC transporter permease [Cryobacterium sp. 5B3]